MIAQTSLDRNGRKMKNFGMSLCVRALLRRSLVVCLALVTVCALLLLTTVNVLASTVTINDQAGVLDAGRVQAEAAQLPVPVLIYTTKTFTGDLNALRQSTIEQLPNQDSIAIGIVPGIDIAHRLISIRYGANVQLSDCQANDAISAAYSNYEHGGNYTSATIAAIDSLRGALGGGGINPVWMPISILLGIGGIVFIVFARRRRRRGGSDDPSRSDSRKWPLTPSTEPEAWADANPYYDGNYPRSPSPGGNPGGGVGIGGAIGGFGGGAGGGGSSGGGAEGHF